MARVYSSGYTTYVFSIQWKKMKIESLSRPRFYGARVAGCLKIHELQLN